MTLRVSELKLHLGQDEAELPHLVGDLLGCDVTSIRNWRILRKSLDARRRDDIHHVYSLAVDIPDLQTDQLPRSVAPLSDASFLWPDSGPLPLKHRPVVVGSGPAGLYAAYMLAISGYQPIMLERGKAVKERVAELLRTIHGGLQNHRPVLLVNAGLASNYVGCELNRLDRIKCRERLDFTQFLAGRDSFRAGRLYADDGRRFVRHHLQPVYETVVRHDPGFRADRAVRDLAVCVRRASVIAGEFDAGIFRLCQGAARPD